MSDQPVLKPLSWQQAKHMDKVQRRLGRKQAQLAQAVTDEEYERLEAELDEAYMEAQRMVAKAVVSIPASWLHEDAPLYANIDWDDPTSLDYLKSNQMTLLVRLVTGAAQEESAKN